MTVTRAVLPREYGAYAELAFPVLSAFLAGGVSRAGLGFALAVVAGFLVREPLAVLNGVRGARLAASLGAPAARLGALIPGAFAVGLAPALLRGRPKTLGAEVLVALALAGMILPIGLCGTMTWKAAVLATSVWAASFVLATLSVHAIKARAKPALGGAWTLWATPALGLAIPGGGLVGAVLGRVPMAVGLAVVPSTLVVLAATVLRPHPRQLKRLGWSLVAANVVTLALLVVG